MRLPSGAATWTVIGGDGVSIDAAEEYLEYLRVSSSPNTVKSYARALALWWRWLQTTQVGWRVVGLSEFTGFVHWLRTGQDGTIVAFAPSAPKLSESTVAVRLQAVLSFYRYQALNGVPAAVALTQRIHRSSPQFRPLLEHVARRRGPWLVEDVERTPRWLHTARPGDPPSVVRQDGLLITLRVTDSSILPWDHPGTS